jgi:hypothetical protein
MNPKRFMLIKQNSCQIPIGFRTKKCIYNRQLQSITLPDPISRENIFMFVGKLFTDYTMQDGYPDYHEGLRCPIRPTGYGGFHLSERYCQE